jgi:hypothetical protein
MDTANEVGKLTFGQLDEAVTELRAIADRLQDFLRGDESAWTAGEIAAAHALIACTGMQVNLVRSIRSAAARRAGVVHLDERRGPAGSVGR